MRALLLLQQHSALEPKGPEATRLAQLFWLFVAIAAVVSVAVIAATLWAAWRRRAPDEDPQAPERERRARTAIAVAAAVSVGFAFMALVAGFRSGQGLHHPAPNPAPLVILVTGHQWWWEVEYESRMPQNRVRTANEIHVPVARPVVLKLRSADVIHSFWAPSLGGKRDLIPGHHNELQFQADSAGHYRVQCAEYCGLQHAHMAMDVVAESEAEFAAWRARQLQPAPPPSDSVQARGRMLLERTTCASCHNVTGTLASGSLGPDLTHVASRLSLGAGTLPNDSASLASWIENPHRTKPGVLMPSHTLSPSDLVALVAYLRSLR